MRYTIPAGYLPVVALIAVQTLGALTAGYVWFVAVIAVETLVASMPPRRPALASLTDAKKVIAWVRQDGAAYGADPSVLIVAGSSAGAHLAAMAALTPGDPAFQPGFEQADTSVSAAICLYGYYGDREASGPRPSSPRAYARADAPPFLLAHGASDPLLPASSAASFADTLRRVSASPVVYAQLPAAQHSFDLFHSIRFEQVIDGIQAFTAWSCRPATTPGANRRARPTMVRPRGPGRPALVTSLCCQPADSADCQGSGGEHRREPPRPPDSDIQAGRVRRRTGLIATSPAPAETEGHPP
jgi:dienelactone hydrolase